MCRVPSWPRKYCALSFLQLPLHSTAQPPNSLAPSEHGAWRRGVFWSPIPHVLCLSIKTCLCAFVGLHVGPPHAIRSYVHNVIGICLWRSVPDFIQAVL